MCSMDEEKTEDAHRSHQNRSPRWLHRSGGAIKIFLDADLADRVREGSFKREKESEKKAGVQGKKKKKNEGTERARGRLV